MNTTQLTKCKACSLHRYRRNVVIGRGDHTTAKYVFLGEGPGRTEDLRAQAFIGPSGKLLDDMIIAAGGRIEECFFTNVVLCHPTDRFAGDNLQPKRVQVLKCATNVMQLIRHDAHVVFVGKIAESFYRREYQDALAITHPGALLRTGGKASAYWQMNINALRKLFEQSQQ